MIGFLKPAPHKERLPKEKIDPTYRLLRWQVFAGIFFGYAAYYFVRRNFDLAMPGLIEAGMYNKAQLGGIGTAIGLSYGLSKFFMAAISDRSNARIFLTLGLVLSGLTMMAMGLIPWATSSATIIFTLLFLNGWFQGMGWPPCGRTMVHWWSKSERGSIVSIWNCAHNVGGLVPGVMVLLAGYTFALSHGGQQATNADIWRQVLWYPGLAAVIFAVVIFFLMRDTPQSCGLPPIEEYKNDYPDDYNEKTYEHDLSTREIFVTYVLNNRLLWYIALANIFVYLIRYGVLSWAPTYLSQEKHFDFKGAAIAYSIYELAAIPGTLLCGWVSDKLFKGRRGLTGVVFMILTTLAVVALWMNPATPVDAAGNVLPEYAGLSWWQNPYQFMDFILMTLVGFLIYGPVMLIGLHALELAPKKAAGTAAGFTGLFGYVGGTVSASAVVGWAAHNFGWDGGFYVMIAGGVLAVILLLVTTFEEASHKKKLGDYYGKSE